MEEILKKLQGGDLRSIGKVNEVVTDILADSILFIAIFDGMSSSDPIIRMRAADAVEKVTRINPTWLYPYKKRLLEEVSQIEQQEVRWHLAQMLPRLDLDEDEADSVVCLLQQWIEESKSNIVKLNSMQSLYDVAIRYPHFEPSVIQVLRSKIENGGPAMKWGL